MRIRLNTLLLGTSLVLMGSTTAIPAMAGEAGLPVESSGFAAEVDAPVTPASDSTTAQDATTPQPTPLGRASAADDDFAPMTRSERLRHYLAGTFGPKALNENAASAEILQLRNVPKEWGRNPAAFGVRFGSEFAEHFIRGTLQYGASAVLHEDNRYRPSGKTGFWKRTGYAISSTFLARRDNGHRRLSFSRIGSAGGAGFISRAWLPHSIATAGAGASSFGVILALDIGSNVFREFWPDIKRNFRRS